MKKITKHNIRRINAVSGTGQTMRIATASQAVPDHVSTADYAVRAGTADNLSEGSPAWETIDEKDAAVLTAAIADAAGKYLSKLEDDTAQGVITFVQGLLLGNGGMGIDGNGNGLLRKIILDCLQGSSYTGEELVGDKGFKLWQDEDGLGNLIVDNLTVRLKAFFSELEIRRVSFTGGDLFFSSAGSKIVMVKPVDAFGNVLTPTYDVLHLLTASGKFLSADGNFYAVKTTAEYTDEELAALTHAWRCYEMSDDGTTQTMNYWQPGDMARCQTFNIDEAGKYQNASNKYYGRLAIRTGREELEDGLTYNYVDLSTDALVDIDGVTCSGYDNRQSIENDIPAVGDHIAQVGSQTDTDRQSLIELCLSDGGSINLYSGVNDWDLSSHRIISEGKHGFIVNSEYFKLTTGGVEQTFEEALKGAEIVTDTASVIVNAGSDGRISAITQVTGLPTFIQVKDGGTVIPPSVWRLCKVNGKTLVNRTGSPSVDVLNPLRPTGTEGTSALNLTWEYVPIISPISGDVMPMQSSKIDVNVSYMIGTAMKSVSLELPQIVNKKGADGTGEPVTISITPSSIILEEYLQTDQYGNLVTDNQGNYIKQIDYTNAYADITIMDGTSQAQPDVPPTVSTAGTGVTASVTGSRIAVSNVQDGVRQAILTVTVVYGGAQYELLLGVYVNRLGTWEMQAIGDIMTSISTREITIYDDQGQPVTTTSISQFYQDSARISVGADTIEFKSGDGSVTYMKMNIVRNSQQQIVGYTVHADNMNIDNLTAANLTIRGNSKFSGRIECGEGYDKFIVTKDTGELIMNGPSMVLDGTGEPDPSSAYIDLMKLCYQYDPDTLRRIARFILAHTAGSLTLDAEEGMTVTNGNKTLIAAPDRLQVKDTDQSLIDKEICLEDGEVSLKSYIMVGQTPVTRTLRLRGDGTIQLTEGSASLISGSLYVDSNGFLKVSP